MPSGVAVRNTISTPSAGARTGQPVVNPVIAVWRGVQSGVQTERNRAQLRATEIAVEPRIAAGRPGSLRLGAGRSQVQILSPRLEIPVTLDKCLCGAS